MIKKVLLTTLLASTMLSAVDYGKMVDSIKTKEAIKTVSKGTDMTMEDVSNSVDSDKLIDSFSDSDSKKEVTKESVKKSAKTTATKVVDDAKKEAKTNDTVNSAAALGKSLNLW